MSSAFRVAIATLLAVPLLAAAPAVRAAEIDSVTPRGVPLRNSMRYMSAWVNERLREGVRRANDQEKGCDEDDLYKQIRRAISFPFVGHLIAEELNADEDLDRVRVGFGESIYQDLGVFDAISVHVKDLSAVIRLDGRLVGVDKFGHFFVQGRKYFDIAYRDGDGIKKALDWGAGTEETYFGYYTTGIYSFADLSVNFEGMRFWLRVLGSERDPLESGYFFNRPYVGCRKSLIWFGEARWRVKRWVHLSDYLSGAWDEGLNCSRYRNEEIRERVAARVRERELLDAADYACPIEPEPCARARERYQHYALRLLHPRCLVAPAEPRAWWKLW